MLLPTNGCWKPSYIPFPLCLWSNEQANHAQEVWQYASRGALGSEHASQFSTNQSIVFECRRTLCFQATKTLICKKVCFKRSRKFQVKKWFDRPRRLLPGSVGSSFNVHMYWYVMNNLNVLDVLIVFLWILNSQGYWFKKQSFKIIDERFPELYLYEATLWAHPCCASQFVRLACCSSPKF